MADKSDEDGYSEFLRHLVSSIEARRIEAQHAARAAINNPLSTASDFTRGAARGLIQAPFDFGAAIAPAIGMIAPAGASVLQPLADRTQAQLERSPLATNSDAGSLGAFLAQLMIPIPGGGKASSGGRMLSDLLRRTR